MRTAISFIVLLTSVLALPTSNDWQVWSTSNSSSSTTGLSTSPFTSSPTSAIRSSVSSPGDPTKTSSTKSASTAVTTSKVSTSAGFSWDPWRNSSSATTTVSSSSWYGSSISSDYTSTSTSSLSDDAGCTETQTVWASAPTATLLPSVHWDHNGDDAQHVLPSDSNSIYYAAADASPDTNHQMAWLTVNYTSATVVLDHSNLLDYDYSSGSSSLSVTFADLTTFYTCQQQWHIQNILVVNDDDCQSGSCHLSISGLDFDVTKLSCTVEVQALDYQQAVSHFDMNWGTYQASSRSTCDVELDNKYGLPTACSGSTFDDDIDAQYGYETVEDSSFGQFYAALTNSDNEDDMRLAKRSFWSSLKNAVEKLVHNVVGIIPLPGITKPFTKDWDLLHLQMKLPQNPPTSNSPWGNQYLLKSFSGVSSVDGEQGNLDIFCVDCGIQGSADLSGHINVELAKGIKSLTADLDATMDMALKIGVDADVAVSEHFTQNLFQVPLSHLCIPGVICVGPWIKLDADVDIDIKAKGQVLAGASLTMDDAHASLDIFGLKAQASGWKPEFTPVFEADGAIELEVDLGLPFTLAVGVDVLGGLWSLEADLVEEPSFSATAWGVTDIEYLNPGWEVSTNISKYGCDGIFVDLEIENEVYVNMSGGKKIVLSDLKLELLDKCYPMSGSPSISTTAIPDLVSSTITTKVPSTSTTSLATTNTTTEITTTASVTGASSSTTGTSTISVTTTSITSSVKISSTSSATFSGYQNSTMAAHSSFSYPASSSTTSTSVQSSKTSSSSSSLVQSTSSSTTATATTTNSAATPTGWNEWASIPAKRDDSGDSNTVQLSSSANDIQFITCDDGSMIAIQSDADVPDACSNTFTVHQGDDLVIGDETSRIFVYYPDEMTKTGASRLRLTDVDDVPAGSDEVVFVPGTLQTSDDQSITAYFPVSSEEQAFYPVVCSYTDDRPSRMFVVNDMDAGINVLLSGDVDDSITGGQVEQCTFVPIVSSGWIGLMP